MWNIFGHIVTSYLQNKGVIDGNISAASVCLINFMVKAPADFKNAQLNNKTPLQMILEFIQKVFDDGEELEDELTSMCAVTLIMACLEHLGDGVQQFIHVINGIYIKQLSIAETKEYKNMLIQGIMMNFTYDQNITI